MVFLVINIFIELFILFPYIFYMYLAIINFILIHKLFSYYFQLIIKFFILKDNYIIYQIN